MRHDIEIDLPEADEGYERYDHRRRTVPGASQRTEKRRIETVDEVERCHETENGGAEHNNFRNRIEERHQLRREDHDRDPDHDGNDSGYDETGADPAAGTFDLSDTEVLTDKGRGGHRDGLQQLDDDRVDLPVGGIAGHTVLAEVIDIRLNENVRERGDGDLDTGGEPDFYDLPENIPGDLQIGQAKPDTGLRPGQTDDHEEGGYKLCYDRSVGNACYAHLENENENEVERCVQQSADDKIIKGMAGIAYGAQDPGAHIVKHQAEQTDEIDDQIGSGFADHVIRRFHEAEHVRRHEDPDRRKDDAEDKRHDDRGMNGFFDFVFLLGAVILGDDDAGAGGKTGKESDEHIDDGVDGTDSGKSLVADIVANHPGVDHIIKQLKQIAGEKGKSKVDDMPGDVPGSHIDIAASVP